MLKLRDTNPMTAMFKDVTLRKMLEKFGSPQMLMQMNGYTMLTLKQLCPSKTLMMVGSVVTT